MDQTINNKPQATESAGKAPPAAATAPAPSKAPAPRVLVEFTAPHKIDDRQYRPARTEMRTGRRGRQQPVEISADTLRCDTALAAGLVKVGCARIIEEGK